MDENKKPPQGENKEVTKGVWHNGIIKTSQMKVSTNSAHLITAKDDSGYLLWLPIKWFRERKTKDGKIIKDELSVGFLETGNYTIFKTEKNEETGYEDRIEEKNVGWQEAFDLFALELPKIIKHNANDKK